MEGEGGGPEEGMQRGEQAGGRGVGEGRRRVWGAWGVDLKCGPPLILE